jgi:hypothetical protein
VIPEVRFEFVTGIRRFASVRDLRTFLKQLMDSYQKEYDKVSSLTGDLLREEDMEADKARSKGWLKAGNLFANKVDPTRAGLDVMLQVMKEAKPKIASLETSLKAFEQIESLQIPEDAALIIYLREGVPERLIVGPATGKSRPQDPLTLP